MKNKSEALTAFIDVQSDKQKKKKKPTYYTWLQNYPSQSESGYDVKK